MQNTSALYKSILSGNHTKEVKLDVYYSDGSVFVYSFGMDRLTSMKTSKSLFSESGFSVGSCVSGELNVSLYPKGANNVAIKIPKMARLIPQIRLIGNNGNVSEWVKKGVYFIDTRDTDKSTGVMSINAFDAMLKAEKDYDTSLHSTYPIKDIAAVRAVASQIGVQVDQRTVSLINQNYNIPIPNGYSCREVLSAVGVAYCASFCISDEGKLLAISLTDTPTVTRFLVDENKQFSITVGGVRILV